MVAPAGSGILAVGRGIGRGIGYIASWLCIYHERACLIIDFFTPSCYIGTGPADARGRRELRCGGDMGPGFCRDDEGDTVSAPASPRFLCTFFAGVTMRTRHPIDKDTASPWLRRLLLAVFILATSIPPARAEVVFDGVAAGDASSTDAILWTRADNGGGTTSLTAQVATDQGFANIVATLGGTTGSDSDFTLKLLAAGLAANTRYYYRFMAPSAVVSPIGQFATAPAASQRAAVKFGFSGDADGRFRPYPSIANLAAQKLDFFVFLGDAIYETASAGSPAVPLITGETTDPTQLEEGLKAYDRKYLENVLGVDPATGQPSTSGQQSLQPMLAATGSYTLLDNHELGNRSLQSGGAPPNPPDATDPAFDVNTTGSYNSKTLAFRTVEK